MFHARAEVTGSIVFVTGLSLHGYLAIVSSCSAALQFWKKEEPGRLLRDLESPFIGLASHSQDLMILTS